MSTETTAQPGTNTGSIFDENPSHSDIQLNAVETAPAAQELIPELNADILLALGSKTSDEPEYGENIHDSLAQLWTPLLKKGMPKDDKEKILKGYLIPQNCTLLQAPKLNPEIAAAITESARNRDKKMHNIQQQLGSGITAINKALDLLIGENGDKLKTIKYLSDACRILSDLHHVETLARIKLVTPSLDKKFLTVVQDTCRDDTLFGNKLPEKIKASKTIEKQGLQIKKSANNPTPAASAVRPSQQRGNWNGPPRYSSSKTARGGTKRTGPSRKPYPAPAAQAKPPPKPQTRAQTSQQ